LQAQQLALQQFEAQAPYQYQTIQQRQQLLNDLMQNALQQFEAQAPYMYPTAAQQQDILQNYINMYGYTPTANSGIAYNPATGQVTVGGTPVSASSGVYRTTVTMPDGTVQPATVMNGITYLDDGSRPPVGAIVHTNAGDYRMTSSGTGVKVG